MQRYLPTTRTESHFSRGMMCDEILQKSWEAYFIIYCIKQVGKLKFCICHVSRPFSLWVQGNASLKTLKRHETSTSCSLKPIVFAMRWLNYRPVWVRFRKKPDARGWWARVCVWICFSPKPCCLVPVSLVLRGVVKVPHKERAQSTEWL